MHVSRRDTFKFLLAGASVAALLPGPAAGAAGGVPARSAAGAAWRTAALGNGFRAHFAAVDTGYVALSLILRSREIVHQHGLAHMMEHTSFNGAAGALTASEVAEAQRNYVQDRNASTALGVIQWDATFLPHYLPQVLALLSDVTLDQKFDVETVSREAKVVLEELYLEKYNAGTRNQREFEVALFGPAHPHAQRTVEEEIASAKLPAETLAAKLRAYAATIRLPANMDMFIAGQIEPAEVLPQVEREFGKYAYASGPYLQLPRVGVTRAYRALAGISHDLTRPLSEIKIGWNTGVTVTDPDARTLVALCEYLNGVLFKQLREEHGDTYTPEVSYQPDACSGIIEITLPSSKNPARVEQRLFQVMQSLKVSLDAREAGRLRDRAELRRRKMASNPEALVECMVRKTIDGASLEELAPEAATPDELVAAARKYLPAHKGAYVRLALRGR